jgi:hypothetical protein
MQAYKAEIKQMIQNTFFSKFADQLEGSPAVYPSKLSPQIKVVFHTRRLGTFRTIMIRLTVVLLLGALTVGCTTPNIEPDFKFRAEARSGVVAGSITYEGSFSGYSVMYRRVGTNSQTGSIRAGAGTVLVPYFPRGDADALGASGELFAVELPEGEYEVHRWLISSGPASVVPTSSFSIRFTVLPGRVIYIGNFHFRRTSRLGLTVTGGELSYLERAERDLPLIKRKYPSIAATTIDVAIKRGASYRAVGGQHRTDLDPPVIIPMRIQ